ncbi:MAG TPA: bifunctional phosphopantothenoylcysteine decarboxylase/phosphopantothenate--cysteine ligase CoaBC [Bacillota bacterium]|nr:bifunctional phosphopantothenoylcysteine decarboxylase/phosphopantothenate--cysteine ligase CoaBC [Bacillota bacterium]
MTGKHLILGVTGGIAIYKVPELISRLRKQGLGVEVIMTESATKFITPLTFREVSANPVHTRMFDSEIDWKVEHIALAKKADGLAVIPATANLIGKVAGGIADDLLTTTIMATAAPKLIAPAMNAGMFANPMLQRNLKMLAELGYTIVGPDSGRLLCGDEGQGRLATLEELELNIQRLLTSQDLAGTTVLVTAGGTREPIDPIRYLGNGSSGKMGHMLARAAFKRGARVLLVTTLPEYAPRAQGIEVFSVNTTGEMRTAVLELAGKAAVIIKAAAPADFSPAETAPRKIKKREVGSDLILKLTANPDILLELGQAKRPDQILVGFAAETNDLRENALEKLNRKNLDLIIGNLVYANAGVGMGADRNQVTIFSRTETLDLPEMSKPELADEILEYIIRYRIQGFLNQS